jgi:uncharacterized membrane protein YheB (UPF0754 family)
MNYSLLLQFILLPLISAFIGWFTNWIAIKMLFHPREPKRILGITFHGIFPKRQRSFAEKLGKMISAEFLSYEDIENKIADPKNLQNLLPLVEAHVDKFLQDKLSDEMPFLSLFIGEKTRRSLKNIFMKELETLFPQIMKSYAKHLEEELDLEKIVTDKVSKFSSDKLEAILYQIMSKEFRFVELLGGIIGFMIGILQVLITYFIPA